ncbi:MAG: SUMF1/EgtB/PvdO family nonheme iron enzyme [Candidatus Cloacimonetes bacterium]|nr:SUMF1/EgtB/PvdO family nonheme iron enzyme [Candidatus Cloacimonadota bacterium]
MSPIIKILILSTFLFTNLHANQDDFFSYHGLFVDDNSQPVIGVSTNSVVITLNRTSIGGISQYSQVFSEVVVTNGMFELKIGPNLPDLSVYKFLELYINGSSVPLTPRIEINSQAKALESSKLGGYTAEDLLNQMNSIANSIHVTPEPQELASNFEVQNQLITNHIVNESIVTKSIKLGTNDSDCVPSNEGIMRYNFISKTVEFCDGLFYRGINSDKGTNISNITTNNATVDFTWLERENVKNYRLYYSQNPEWSTQDSYIETTANQVNLDQLLAWEQYYITIETIYNNNESAVSKTNSINIIPSIENLKVEPYNNEVYLSWTAIPLTTSYTVFYNDTPDVDSNPLQLQSSLASITLTNLSNHQAYYFKIQANGANNKISLSNIGVALPLSRWIEPNFSIEMVKLSSGTFQMGSVDPNDSIPDRNLHDVTISQDLYVAKYELTRTQWESITSNPLSTANLDPNQDLSDLPVTDVTYTQLVQKDGFLDQLNESINCDMSSFINNETRYHPNNVPSGCFRLPTEAEWEYMATYGNQFEIQWQPEVTNENYIWQESYITSVHDLSPNPWGLSHVSGNALEFVYDRHDTQSKVLSTKALFGTTSDPVFLSQSNQQDQFYISKGKPNSHYRNGISSRQYNQLFDVGLRLIINPQAPTQEISHLTINSGYDFNHLHWETFVGASSYMVYFNTTGNVSESDQSITTTLNDFKFDNLDHNLDYYYKVKPIISSHSTQLSTEVSASPNIQAIPFTYYRLEGNSVTLNWDPIPSATEYEIYEIPFPSATPTLTSTTDVTTATLTSLNTFQDYQFFIVAKNQEMQSDPSPVFEISPLPVMYGPAINYHLTMVPQNSHSVMIQTFSSDSETPIHYTPSSVVLPQDIWIGTQEVTQDQWQFVMTGHTWPYGDYELSRDQYIYPDLPAFGMDLYEVTAIDGFLDRLNNLVGCDTSGFSPHADRYDPVNIPSGCYRLPTPEEWEFVSYAGNSESSPYGNFKTKIMFENSIWHKNNSQLLQVVDSNIPNKWGIYNMFGNVSEMVYESNPTIVKGGSIYSIHPNEITPSYEEHIGEYLQHSVSFLGLRLVYIP